MNNKKIKIAIIGCGQIVQIMHLPFLISSDLYEVVAICDVSQNIIDQIGDKFCIPVERRFVDFERLFELDFNACLIATIDHYTPALMSVNNGKHIFVEKPLSYNLVYADEIISVVKKKNLIAQVGYMKLYDPAVRYAKSILNNIDNFNLIHIHDFAGSFSYTDQLFKLFSGDDVDDILKSKMNLFIENSKKHDLDEKHKKYFEAYSLICGIASHDLAVIRYLFGTPEVLYSNVYNNNIVIAQMRVSGIPIQFESGYIPNRKIWDEVISVYSNEVNLSIKFPWPYLKNSPTKVFVNYDDSAGNNINSVYESGFSEGYELQWEDFYNSILEGKQPIANAFEARDDILIASQLINSCQVLD